MSTIEPKNWWIQIAGVTGEGTATPVIGYIELLGFYLSLTSTITSVGQSPNKPVFNPCSIVLKGDAAAGTLYKNMAGGVTLGSITIKGLKTANKEPAVFVEYTFTDAYTLSLNFSQGGDGGLAIGNLSFVFTKIVVQSYSQNEATGAMQATSRSTYDLPSQTLS
jgi:type VI protein secretion system component Hcp